MAVEKDCRGVYNIVGDGVVPLSRVLRLAGKRPVPVPAPLLYPAVQALWYANILNAPASRLDFLKYISVADGEKAARAGFTPNYSSRQALQAFLGAERIRKVQERRS